MKAAPRLQENLKLQHSPSKLPIQMVRIPCSSVAIKGHETKSTIPIHINFYLIEFKQS